MVDSIAALIDLVFQVGDHDRNTTKPLDCFDKKSRASSKNILVIEIDVFVKY